MKQNQLTRILSMLLVLVVTMMSLPLLAYAEDLGINEIAECGTNEANTRAASSEAYVLGVEDYYPLINHSVPSGGIGYVNLSSGTHHLSIPLISTTDSLLTFGVALNYNSPIAGNEQSSSITYNAYPDSYAPYGFKLNICETILPISGNSLVYEDADGTAHLFVVDGDEYKDVDGLQMRISSLDGRLVLKYVDGTKKYFSEMSTSYGFVLDEIRDRNGNAVLIELDDDLPSKLYLKPNGEDAIETLQFVYTSDSKLAIVVDPVSLDAVILRYSEDSANTITNGQSNYLTAVEHIKCTSNGSTSAIAEYWYTYEDNGIVLQTLALGIHYQADGKIARLMDTIGQKSVNIAYTNGKPSSLCEIGSTLGQALSITYGTGYAEVKSTGNDEQLNTNDDIITRYIFDSNGRAVNVYSISADRSVVYGAVMGEYEEQDEVKNNIKKKTVIGGSPVNYILDGGFESWYLLGSSRYLNYWTGAGDVTQANESEFTGNGIYCAKFVPEIDVPASISQTVTIPAGEYTLSFDINCSAMESVYGTVKVESTTETDFEHIADIPRNTTINTGRRGTFATTFTVPANNKNENTVKITIEFSKQAENSAVYSENIYINNATLERGVGRSSFSLVNSGSFNDLVTNSTASTFWSGDLQILEVHSQFGNTAILSGTGSTTSSIKQTVSSVGSMSHVGASLDHDYIISGFACRLGQPSAEQVEVIRLRVDVNYYDSLITNPPVTQTTFFDFLPEVEGWQFISGRFSAGSIRVDGVLYDYVESIDVSCEYIGPSGCSVAFDNIAVVVEDEDNMHEYTYYGNGLVKTEQTLYYTEYYEYNDNKDVTRIGNNRGEMTSFYYNEAGQICYEIKYEFINTTNNSLIYPLDAAINSEIPTDSLIEKTPKQVTAYTYNDYGQITSVVTYDNVAYSSGSTLITTVDGTAIYTTAQTKRMHSQYSYETTAGSRIFGALIQENSENVYKTRYFYDEIDGKLLASINTVSGTGICYTYDDYDRVISTMPVTYSSSAYVPQTSSEKVSYVYDSQHRLSTVNTRTTSYSFTYGDFDQTTAIKVGDTSLATYEYNENNGKLIKTNYANGLSVEYVYNTLEKLSEVWYTNGDEEKELAYSYEYTAGGQLYKFSDERRGENTVYRYDNQGRITESAQYSDNDMEKEFSSSFSYNATNGLILEEDHHINFTFGNAPDYTSTGIYYTYNEDDSLNRTYQSNFVYEVSTQYFFDEYDRITSVDSEIGEYGNATPGLTIDKDYTYLTYGNGSTNLLVSSFTSTVNGTATTYAYTYDSHGYILSEAVGGTTTYYSYDDLGQLKSRANGTISFSYSYDNAGNITSVSRTVGSSGIIKVVNPGTPTVLKSFSYSDSEWGDLLTSYNGTTITYDSLGNPLSYYNGSSYTFTWEGRRLVGAIKGSKTMSFNYDDNGLRTCKTVNGIVTEYFWSGTRLIAEKSPTELIVYVYDANGTPIGMQYRASTYGEDEWDVYWFEKNLFGDVVAIYNASGTLLGNYSYNDWGSTTITYSNGGASTTATKNPFCYRGYYYDLDLGLYYLNSRYYDANTYRFINADEFVSTGQGLLGYNMFAYCNNNPINSVDNSGAIPGNVMVDLNASSLSSNASKIDFSCNSPFCPGELTITGPSSLDPNPSISVSIYITNKYATPLAWESFSKRLVEMLELKYIIFLNAKSIDVEQFIGEVKFHAFLNGLGILTANANPIDINIYSDGSVRDSRPIVNIISEMFSRKWVFAICQKSK